MTWMWCKCGSQPLLHGQPEGEAAALIRLALNFYLATMGSNEITYDGKTEAQAVGRVSIGFHAVKWLEDVCLLL